MRHKAFVLPAGGILVLVFGFLMFGNLNSNLVYYLEPTEASERMSELGTERFRLGGQVVEGSLLEVDGAVHFALTDGATSVQVVHDGAPPELFREGIGAIVEGAWTDEVFHSDNLLVKHDENYSAPRGEAAGGS